MEIKNLQGKVLFKNDSSSIKETIEDAIRKGISLRKANLIGADLSGADLIGADLSLAYLIDADIKHANLKGAYLIDADIKHANLKGAYLRNADLSGAVLNGADLRDADLNGADLKYASLIGAYLSSANFIGANFISADLRGANLNYANLSGANLSCANLSLANLNGTDLIVVNLSGANLSLAKLINAKNVPYVPLACPSEGSFIGWKKIYYLSIEYLVKLRIPEDARRCSATTSKCRCDKAEVLSIERLSTGDKDVKQVVNSAYHECTYTVGKMVYPDSFDENRWNECSHGIHFFINKQDAINY